MNYLPFGLLTLLTGRMLVLGGTLPEAIGIIPLSLLCGYVLYLNSKKELPINDVVKQELAQMKSTLDALKVAKSMNIGRLG